MIDEKMRIETLIARFEGVKSKVVGNEKKKNGDKKLQKNHSMHLYDYVCVYIKL